MSFLDLPGVTVIEISGFGGGSSSNTAESRNEPYSELHGLVKTYLESLPESEENYTSSHTERATELKGRCVALFNDSTLMALADGKRRLDTKLTASGMESRTPLAMLAEMQKVERVVKFTGILQAWKNRNEMEAIPFLRAMEKYSCRELWATEQKELEGEAALRRDLQLFLLNLPADAKEIPEAQKQQAEALLARLKEATGDAELEAFHERHKNSIDLSVPNGGPMAMLQMAATLARVERHGKEHGDVHAYQNQFKDDVEQQKLLESLRGARLFFGDKSDRAEVAERRSGMMSLDDLLMMALFSSLVNGGDGSDDEANND